MAQQIRDLFCTGCGKDYPDVLCTWKDYGKCITCASPLDWRPTWNGATGGLYGSPLFSDATGQYHSSQHEKEMVMAKKGYYPAGDPVGGARKDHTLKHTAISFPGQSSRTSTGERSRSRVSGTPGT